MGVAIGLAGVLVVGCSHSDGPSGAPREIGQSKSSLIWPEFDPLTAPAPVNYMQFGAFVDVDGDLAITGAPTGGNVAGQGSSAEARPGQAFVFARHRRIPPLADTWSLEATLVPLLPTPLPAGTDYRTDWSEFGSAVAIDGNLAVVGADGTPDGTFIGAAYVFERTASPPPGTSPTWVLRQRLRPTNPSPTCLGQARGGIRYGRSVGISGDRIVVCSAKTDVPRPRIDYPTAYPAGCPTDPADPFNAVTLTAFNDTGTAWVYERQPSGVWFQVAELEASDRNAGDQFGINCRISGDYIVVGAFQADQTVLPDGGASFKNNSGAAYVFERQGGDSGPVRWVEKQKLVARDAAALDNFGVSVSIDGTTIAVAAKGADASPAALDTGAAYVFDRQPSGTWTETQKLAASDAVAADSFGNNVAISGGHLIVGAGAVDGPDVDPATQAPIVSEGAAYFFTRTSGGTWVEERKVHPNPPVASSGFGLQVNIDGALGIVASGFYSRDLQGPQQGAAFLFGGVDATAGAQPCTEDQYCGSGHCEDRDSSGVGLCCDRACGVCESCLSSKRTGLPDGQCGPVAAETDPDNECVDPTCTAGVQTGNECDGKGACVTADIDCITYACSTVGDRCNLTCKADADCAPDSFCDTTVHQCFGNRANGTACIADTQCKTRNCVDGVCCNSTCPGQCEACDVPTHPGTCTAVADAPHGTKRKQCTDNQDACAGTCDGQHRPSCTYPGGTTNCKTSTCAANDSEQPYVCDGTGTCVEGAPIACGGNFACIDTGCKTGCASEADCTAGFVCSGGKCIPNNGTCSKDKTQVLDAVGVFQKDCSPYFCVSGQCAASCAQTTECQTGFVCDRAAKTCKQVAPPPPSDPVGCFCRMAPPRAGGARGAAWSVASLALVLGLRRRSRSRATAG